MTLATEEYIALSTAAYTNFNEDKGVTVNDLLSKIPHSSESQALSLHSSLAGWKLLNFQLNTSNGFAAAFQAPSTIDENGNSVPGEIVFAFRGTEPFSDNLHDLGQDLKIMMAEEGALDAQFNDAYSFWLQTIQDVGGGSGYSGYSFTGHSLGGGIAQYMTYATGEVGHSVTFNAVGIGQGIQGVNPSNYDDSVTDYVNENDVIGQYGVQLGKTKYVQDNGNYQANSEIDKIKLALSIATINAEKNGNISQANTIKILSVIINMGQGIGNEVSDAALLGAHGLDPLMTHTDTSLKVR